MHYENIYCSQPKEHSHIDGHSYTQADAIQRDPVACQIVSSSRFPSPTDEQYELGKSRIDLPDSLLEHMRMRLGSGGRL